MKLICFGMAACLVAAAGTVSAREFGTPALMPDGATIGVPVGANLPTKGLTFSSRNGFVSGNAVDGNGNKIGVGVNVEASALQALWNPGWTWMGGGYHAMALIAYQNIKQTMGGTSLTNQTISDLTLSPLNLSWMVRPGVFVAGGLAFGVPVAKWRTDNKPQGGDNAMMYSIFGDFSYLKNGWNLSADLNWFAYGENRTTHYRSGNEILVDWTAMKDLGSFDKSLKGLSVGPVGYWRKQLTGDVNNGSYYGGATAGKLEEVAVGLGLSTSLGPAMLHVNFTHDIRARNTLDANIVNFDITVPLGG